MISEAAIDKEVAKRGVMAAGKHYRRVYMRANGQLDRALVYSPGDQQKIIVLRARVRDAYTAMEYIARKHLGK